MKVAGMRLKSDFLAKVFVLRFAYRKLIGTVTPIPKVGCLHLQGQFVSLVRVCSFSLLRRNQMNSFKEYFTSLMRK